MEVLLKIIDELAKDYEDKIPLTLVIDKALQEEVEQREEMLRFLAKYLAIIYTSPTTFKRTFPSV